MRRLTFIIAALASLACGPAGAVDFDSAIGKTGIGRCHMDVCSFFQIQTSEPIAVLKDGTLFAISELSWTAEYKQHGDEDDHEYDRAPGHPICPYCRRTHRVATGSLEVTPLVFAGAILYEAGQDFQEPDPCPCLPPRSSV